MSDTTEPTEVPEALGLPKTPPKAGHFLLAAGLGLTLGWMTILCLYALSNWAKFADLRPNEMGDFFAGAFAPLAFFWLVLGFFQQGKELRHSGEALWLQGRELQHSVEQQRELVKVTREQLKWDGEVMKEQRREMLRSSRPLLELRAGGNAPSQLANHRRYDFILANFGRPCTAVVVECDRPGKIFEFPDIKTGKEVAFTLDLPTSGEEGFEVIVYFRDERLRSGQKSFVVDRAEAVFHIAEEYDPFDDDDGD